MRGHRVMNFVTLTSRPTACETDGTGGLKDSRPNCNRLNLSTCKRQHLATTDDAHTHTHTLMPVPENVIRAPAALQSDDKISEVPRYSRRAMRFLHTSYLNHHLIV